MRWNKRKVSRLGIFSILIASILDFGLRIASIWDLEFRISDFGLPRLGIWDLGFRIASIWDFGFQILDLLKDYFLIFIGIRKVEGGRCQVRGRKAHGIRLKVLKSTFFLFKIRNPKSQIPNQEDNPKSEIPF